MCMWAKVEAALSLTLAIIVIYITSGSMLAGDVLVLAITWIKTYGHFRHTQRIQTDVSVSGCLLRDGKPQGCITSRSH